MYQEVEVSRNSPTNPSSMTSVRRFCEAEKLERLHFSTQDRELKQGTNVMSTKHVMLEHQPLFAPLTDGLTFSKLELVDFVSVASANVVENEFQTLLSLLTRQKRVTVIDS